MSDSADSPRRSDHTPRVQPIDPRRLSDAQRRVFEQIAGTRGRVAGPFTVLLHVPELADRVQRLGAYLRYEALLPRNVAELAVLVTARTWGSPFEWEAHEPHARRAGLDEATIEAVRSDSVDTIADAGLRAAAELAAALSRTARVPDATYRAVLDRLGTDATVELTVLVGYYSMLAMVLGGHALEST